jgi:hypothetical protein
MRPPQRGVQHLTGDNVRGDGDWGKIGELIGGDHVAMRKTDATNAWVGAVVRQSQLTSGVRVSTVRGEWMLTCGATPTTGERDGLTVGPGRQRRTETDRSVKIARK